MRPHGQDEYAAGGELLLEVKECVTTTTLLASIRTSCQEAPPASMVSVLRDMGEVMVSSSLTHERLEQLEFDALGALLDLDGAGGRLEPGPSGACRDSARPRPVERRGAARGRAARGKRRARLGSLSLLGELFLEKGREEDGSPRRGPGRLLHGTLERRQRDTAG